MHGHSIAGFAIGLALAAGLSAGGEHSVEDDLEPRQVPLAGMSVAESDLLLREPTLATFIQYGTPRPPEPIEGLEGAIAKAFPEQLLGSSYPWSPVVVEFLAPTPRSCLLRLDGEASDEGRSDPLWSESLELVAAERCVLVFAVRRRSAGSRDVALRRALVRSGEQDGVWRITGTDVRDDAIPTDALPTEGDTELHKRVFRFPVGYRGLRPDNLPYALGMWLWLPPRMPGGSVMNIAASQPYQIVVDGSPYSAVSSGGHAFWTLAIASAATPK